MTWLFLRPENVTILLTDSLPHFATRPASCSAPSALQSVSAGPHTRPVKIKTEENQTHNQTFPTSALVITPQPASSLPDCSVLAWIIDRLSYLLSSVTSYSVFNFLNVEGRGGHVLFCPNYCYYDTKGLHKTLNVANQSDVLLVDFCVLCAAFLQQ